MKALISSAQNLANALDVSYGSEHPQSKTIRRYLNKFNGTQAEIITKFRSLIDHDDGLLDSVDNDLIQLCYASDDKEHEHDRVQTCIALISARTTFVKNILAVA
jgi:hypothetical protein